MPDNVIFEGRTAAEAESSAMTIQKCGSLASFLMAAAYLVAPLIYLTGDLRTSFGPLSYDLADFLYGPLWAASLVTAVYALRERIGELAPRCMTLALLAAFVAAAMFVAVASIRSSNRHYHTSHPELALEMSTPVLVVWTTLIAGVSAAVWHFLGWVQLLVGSAGWTSRRLPRALSALYLLGGSASLFVYRAQDIEPTLVMLGVVVSTWLGFVLWKAGPAEKQAFESEASQQASKK